MKDQSESTLKSAEVSSLGSFTLEARDSNEERAARVLKEILKQKSDDVVQGVEALVCQDIARRQRLGITKYGTTVSENPLPLRDWLQHAYEESLDLPIYLRRAIQELDNKAHVEQNVEQAPSPENPPVDGFVRTKNSDVMNVGLLVNEVREWARRVKEPKPTLGGGSGTSGAGILGGAAVGSLASGVGGGVGVGISAMPTLKLTARLCGAITDLHGVDQAIGACRVAGYDVHSLGADFGQSVQEHMHGSRNNRLEIEAVDMLMVINSNGVVTPIMQAEIDYARSLGKKVSYLFLQGEDKPAGAVTIAEVAPFCPNCNVPMLRGKLGSGQIGLHCPRCLVGDKKRVAGGGEFPANFPAAPQNTGAQVLKGEKEATPEAVDYFKEGVKFATNRFLALFVPGRNVFATAKTVKEMILALRVRFAEEHPRATVEQTRQVGEGVAAVLARLLLHHENELVTQDLLNDVRRLTLRETKGVTEERFVAMSPKLSAPYGAQCHPVGASEATQEQEPLDIRTQIQKNLEGEPIDKVVTIVEDMKAEQQEAALRADEQPEQARTKKLKQWQVRQEHYLHELTQNVASRLIGSSFESLESLRETLFREAAAVFGLLNMSVDSIRESVRVILVFCDALYNQRAAQGLIDILVTNDRVEKAEKVTLRKIQSGQMPGLASGSYPVLLKRWFCHRENHRIANSLINHTYGETICPGVVAALDINVTHVETFETSVIPVSLQAYVTPYDDLEKGWLENLKKAWKAKLLQHTGTPLRYACIAEVLNDVAQEIEVEFNPHAKPLSKISGISISTDAEFEKPAIEKVVAAAKKHLLNAGFSLSKGNVETLLRHLQIVRGNNLEHYVFTTFAETLIVLANTRPITEALIDSAGECLLQDSPRFFGDGEKSGVDLFKSWLINTQHCTMIAQPKVRQWVSEFLTSHGGELTQEEIAGVCILGAVFYLMYTTRDWHPETIQEAVTAAKRKISERYEGTSANKQIFDLARQLEEESQGVKDESFTLAFVTRHLPELAKECRLSSKDRETLAGMLQTFRERNTPEGREAAKVKFTDNGNAVSIYTQNGVSMIYACVGSRFIALQKLFRQRLLEIQKSCPSNTDGK